MDELIELQSQKMQKIEKVSEEPSKGRFSFKEILKSLEEKEAEKEALDCEKETLLDVEEKELEKDLLIKERKKKEESLSFETPLQMPTFYQPTFISNLEQTASVSSLLPSAMVEVKEKLIDPIQVLSKKGITKVSLHIETETFSHLEIQIDHYDTAPHSFNIFIKGNEKANRAFEQHQKALQASLKASLPHFECTLFVTPSLKSLSFYHNKKTKNPLVKSKELSYSADNDEDYKE